MSLGYTALDQKILLTSCFKPNKLCSPGCTELCLFCPLRDRIYNLGVDYAITASHSSWITQLESHWARAQAEGTSASWKCRSQMCQSQGKGYTKVLNIRPTLVHPQSSGVSRWLFGRIKSVVLKASCQKYCCS